MFSILQYYRKLSIKPILERLNSPELDPKMRDQAITQMGLAGPETLLVGLRKDIKFDQKEEGELDGKKVWKLRGTWRSRQGLVGPDGRPVIRRRLLASLHPDGRHALPGQGRRLALQARSRGPKAVDSVRDPPHGPDGRPIGAKSSIEKITPSEITLIYTDVKLNAKISV